jgi:hypothetical protein
MILRQDNSGRTVQRPNLNLGSTPSVGWSWLPNLETQITRRVSQHTHTVPATSIRLTSGQATTGVDPLASTASERKKGGVKGCGPEDGESRERNEAKKTFRKICSRLVRAAGTTGLAVRDERAPAMKPEVSNNSHVDASQLKSLSKRAMNYSSRIVHVRGPKAFRSPNDPGLIRQQVRHRR